MIKVILTKSEQNAFNAMLAKSGSITSRDEIAQAIWGNKWLQKYSDWRIDRLIYLLRHKIPENFKIKTLRNSGYFLVNSEITIPKTVQEKVEGTLPTESYLEYMNNPANKRKVLKDLFAALKAKPFKLNNVLVINSYSFDNVDTIAKHYPDSKVYFSNFDSRAIKIHQERIEELKLKNFNAVHDDIRDTIFKDKMFDLVINDFRLNFNTTDSQNVAAIKNIYRITKPNSKVLISVVIDPRYENQRYGTNQENAPTNTHKPWKFVAEENLTRFCFTVPYYKRLFTDNGFKKFQEFDTKNGKIWNPPYRRFILTK